MKHHTAPMRRLVLGLTAGLALTGCVGVLGTEQGVKSTRNYAQMADRFAELSAQSPEDLSASVGLARALRYDGDTAQALTVLESVRPRHSNAADFHTEVGATRLAAGDVDGAERALRRALLIDPDYWRTHATLGVAHSMSDRHHDALRAYEAAIEQCPQSASIHNNMGLAAANVGDIDAAVAWLGLARTLQPESQQIANNYEVFAEVDRACPRCTHDDVRKLAAALRPSDWARAAGDLACGPSAADIARALRAREFIDVRVEFEFDSDVLLPGAKATLDEVSLALMSSDFFAEDFLVEGHTDAVGTADYNQALSERRAASVVRHLTQTGGIAPERLDAVGYGEQRLRDPSNPDASTNRRVRIAVVR